MLPIKREDGQTVAFIGRARPGGRADTPKYLNSPGTSLYTKGEVLFGLHEARAALARGARPAIVEGPFDAIAVSIADPNQLAGAALVGTALTGEQAAALNRMADLERVGVLVALDGDRAGHNAAIKAYAVLRGVTAKLDAAVLPPGRDPAEILQTEGPDALRAVLRERVRPLADLVTDAAIDRWETRFAEGQLAAMRAAASMIASTLPPETIEHIVQASGGRTLQPLDDDLRPIRSRELEAISRVLPADAIRQILRVGERLEFDCSDITAEIAHAVTRANASPKHHATAEAYSGCGEPGHDAVCVALPSFSGPPNLTMRQPTVRAGLARSSGADAARRRGSRNNR